MVLGLRVLIYRTVPLPLVKHFDVRMKTAA